MIIAGVIGIFGGLGQFLDAYKAGFRKDLKRNQMTRAQRVTVDSLGRFGMVARGVIFGIVGIFVLVAGLHRDAGDAHSFGPAFAAVAREPLGHVLLALVALGFVALGIHSWANARWVRMPHPTRCYTQSIRSSGVWPADASAARNRRTGPPEMCWWAVQRSQMPRSSAVAAMGRPQSQNGVSRSARSISSTMWVLSFLVIPGSPNIDTMRSVS